MKNLIAKIINVQNLMMLASAAIAVGAAFMVAHKFLIPMSVGSAIKMPEASAGPVDPALEKKRLEVEKLRLEKEERARKKEEEKKKAAAEKARKEKEEIEKKKFEKGELVGPMFTMNPIIVNLAGTNARRFLKVTVAFELQNEKMSEEFDKRLPQITDLLVTLFSSCKLEDLTEMSGREVLRSEIKDRLNLLLVTGKVQKVYFNDLVIQ